MPLGHLSAHIDFVVLLHPENHFPNPPLSLVLIPKGMIHIHLFSLWDLDVLRNSISHLWKETCGCAYGIHSWASGVYLKQESTVPTHMMDSEQFLLRHLGFKYKLEAVSQVHV